MLPYCVAKYKTLGILFNDKTCCSRCLSNLQQSGYIEKRQTHIKSSYRSYDVKYIKLTEKGLLYLCRKYSKRFPWLPIVASYLEDDPISQIHVRRATTNVNLQRTLQIQSAHLFWSMAGIESIYERMQQPTQFHVIAETIRVTGKTWKEYTPNLFAEAMEVYLASGIEEAEIGGFTAEAKLPAFFDIREVLARESALTAQRKQYRTEAPSDAVMFQNNHIGILRGSDNDYVIYTTTPHGIKWNPGIISRNARKINRQFEAIGSTRYESTPASGYCSIILCMNSREFALAVNDRHKQRGKNQSNLGNGAYAVYLLPISDDGISLGNQIVCDENYEWKIIHRTAENVRNLSLVPGNIQFPFVCMGISCASALTFNVKRLPAYRSLADRKKSQDDLKGVVCWEWQAPYIRSILEESRIYTISNEKWDAELYVEDRADESGMPKGTDGKTERHSENVRS